MFLSSFGKVCGLGNFLLVHVDVVDWPNAASPSFMYIKNIHECTLWVSFSRTLGKYRICGWRKLHPLLYLLWCLTIFNFIKY
jgi:hypothetical protein